MEVRERVVVQVTEGPPPDLGWFVARQPGIARYLEVRLGPGSDAFGAALQAASLVHAAFERGRGVPPARVGSGELERLEVGLVDECDGPVPPAFTARQPALAAFVASLVSDPPVPLSDEELTRVAVCLATVVAALDAT